MVGKTWYLSITQAPITRNLPGIKIVGQYHTHPNNTFFSADDVGIFFSVLTREFMDGKQINTGLNSFSLSCQRQIAAAHGYSSASRALSLFDDQHPNTFGGSTSLA